MRTLYVSDLDGTLLRSNEKTSEYTNRVINSLTERGMIFSYATARSLITAKKVTSGINAKIPLIVYNGAFVIDNLTEEILAANYFDRKVHNVLDDLFANKIYPIVYAYINGKEKFSFVPELCSEGANKFLVSRKGDIRTNEVKTISDLKSGDIFYILCIDEPQKLKRLYEKYKDSYHCVYQTELYTKEQWLEIMPHDASKANAIKQLQALMKCEKLVVFGDGKNDIDMFELADESYAVQNAHPELKRIATGIISSNDEDGVANWLNENFVFQETRHITHNMIKHYDLLINEGNDPVKDSKPLQEYMDNWDGASFINQMILNRKKSVLEVGVGTGRLAVRVAPLCGKFYGIDISPKTIERAKENLQEQNNVRLYCGDFVTFEFNETFDVIYSSLTFMHIEEKQKAINKVAALLKDGGRFVLSIDKNQDKFIDAGTRKVTVFPDRPIKIESYISNAGLILIEHYETRFAHIFAANKKSV